MDSASAQFALRAKILGINNQKSDQCYLTALPFPLLTVTAGFESLSRQRSPGVLALPSHQLRVPLAPCSPSIGLVGGWQVPASL